MPPSVRPGVPFGYSRWLTVVSYRPLFAPASWWFGDTTGIARRDYELGAFAWFGRLIPLVRPCMPVIRSPTQTMSGKDRTMGWCNETASTQIKLANNTLVKDERIAAYTAFQTESPRIFQAFRFSTVLIPCNPAVDWFCPDPGEPTTLII